MYPIELANEKSLLYRIFLILCYNEKYILLGMISFRQVILKFILFIDAKNHKLAIAQTCDFLNASTNKIN